MSLKKGFTLIEVIASIVVFSIAMIGIVMFSASNSRSVVRSEREAKLSVIGEKAFESFKAWTMEETPTGDSLVFDRLWYKYSAGNLMYQTADTHKTIAVRSRIYLEEREFQDDSPVASGSRMRCMIVTREMNTSRADTSFIALSRHR